MAKISDYTTQETLMAKCLNLAQRALDKGNSPFGAIICDHNM